MVNKLAFDPELLAIADYVANYQVNSDAAYQNAQLCLLDTLGCGILALNYPPCTKLLGPIVPGTQVPNGARVPGTPYKLDPVQAAFNIGTMNRWLDFNDTWLAAEWSHPSDNLGGILAVADHLSRCRLAQGQPPLLVQDVLDAMIKAYEIQGVIALKNSFNQVGLDHVILVKVATTAVVTHLLGGDEVTIAKALSQAWIDGHSLRTYRHAPNTGSRKSWAGGDATSRGVRLAMLTLAGERGALTPLTAKTWGFYDALFGGKPFEFERPLGTYIMENILLKVPYPAEFHGQTALECAIALHPQVKGRLQDISCIKLTTQASAMRIINKQGPLHNPADRDHCLQYIVAVGLLNATLSADDYEANQACDPRIDHLRDKMEVTEDVSFSKDYLNPNKRSIANSLQIFFKEGEATEKLTIEYPLGHPRRRLEAKPALLEKFINNVSEKFSQKQVEKITNTFNDQLSLRRLSVTEFIDLFL